MGLGALYAVHAAAVDSEIKYIELHGLPKSFQGFIETKDFEYDPRFAVFGILRHWDIPELLASLAGHKVVLCERQ